jgi:hypothetical protein
VTKAGQIVAQLIGSDATKQEVERVRATLRALADRLPPDLHAEDFRKELTGAAAAAGRSVRDER